MVSGLGWSEVISNQCVSISEEKRKIDLYFGGPRSVFTDY